MLEKSKSNGLPDVKGDKSQKITLEPVTDLHEARILGEIEPMEYVPEPMAKVSPEDEVLMVDDPGKFMYFVSKAKVEGKDLEVSDSILNYILNGRPGDAVTYKGVRVFRQSRREEILREGAMDAESYHSHIIKKKMK